MNVYNVNLEHVEICAIFVQRLSHAFNAPMYCLIKRTNNYITQKCLILTMCLNKFYQCNINILISRLQDLLLTPIKK